MEANFAELPEEVLKMILGRVDVTHLHAVSSVCKRWRDLTAEGLFVLDLEVPVGILPKWLGSADDDGRGAGVHLDATRQVKVVFCGPKDSQQRRIAGRLPTISGPALPESQKQADVEVWTRVVIARHRREHLEDAIRNLGGRRSGGGAAPARATERCRIALVGRLPAAGSLASCDLALSVAGSASTQRAKLQRFLRGASLRFATGLQNIAASGCSRLAWAILPSSAEFAKFDSCSNLVSLSRSDAGSPPQAALHTLDLSHCTKLDPECLPQLCIGGSSRPPPLQNLHLVQLRQVPEPLLASLLMECRSLSTISLRGVATDEVVKSVSDGCPKLTGIDMAFSPLVQGPPILMLLAKNPSVVKCNVRGCPHVTPKEYWDIAYQMRDRNLALAANS